MAGISEKGNNGLFGNEVEFNGKYAIYARFLRDDVGIFQTFREVYVTSAIVGYLNDRTETIDKNEKVQSASIFPNELSKRKIDLRHIYRTIMLLKEEDGFTLDDYKNRAFRDDPEENPEVYKRNMQIFNSYACGGVEYLYEMFRNTTSVEEVVDELYQFVHDFSVDVGLGNEEELPEFELKL